MIFDVKDLLLRYSLLYSSHESKVSAVSVLIDKRIAFGHELIVLNRLNYKIVDLSTKPFLPLFEHKTMAN